MPIIEVEPLKKMCAAILKAAGTPPEEAEIVVDSIISANLRGVDSHGARNLPRYIRAIKNGKIEPGAPILTIKETATTALWDVNNAFGFVAGKKAMECAIRKAEQNIFGAVGTYNSKGGFDHIGALGYYSEMAAQKNMVGIVTSSRLPRVAAWGGKSKVLAINPLSIAVPAANNPPINLDISMTNASRGHLKMMMARGEKVPEGWILDSEGNSITDPKVFFEGNESGVLLPFGGHKGYGLEVIIEAITGGLGAGCSLDSTGFGHLYVAVDPSGFVPLEAFKSRIERLIMHLKASATIPGVEEVFIPGEIENRMKLKRMKEGIPLEDVFWNELKDTAEGLGIRTQDFIS